jgi:hypothetical protein
MAEQEQGGGIEGGGGDPTLGGHAHTLGLDTGVERQDRHGPEAAGSAPVLALIRYTNARKLTLLNCLTVFYSRCWTQPQGG